MVCVSLSRNRRYFPRRRDVAKARMQTSPYGGNVIDAETYGLLQQICLQVLGASSKCALEWQKEVCSFPCYEPVCVPRRAIERPTDEMAAPTDHSRDRHIDRLATIAFSYPIAPHRLGGGMLHQRECRAEMHDRRYGLRRNSLHHDDAWLARHRRRPPDAADITRMDFRLRESFFAQTNGIR